MDEENVLVQSWAGEQDKDEWAWKESRLRSWSFTQKLSASLKEENSLNYQQQST